MYKLVSFVKTFRISVSYVSIGKKNNSNLASFMLIFNI